MTTYTAYVHATLLVHSTLALHYTCSVQLVPHPLVTSLGARHAAVYDPDPGSRAPHPINATICANLGVCGTAGNQDPAWRAVVAEHE